MLWFTGDLDVALLSYCSRAHGLNIIVNCCSPTGKEEQGGHWTPELPCAECLLFASWDSTCIISTSHTYPQGWFSPTTSLQVRKQTPEPVRYSSDWFGCKASISYGTAVLPARPLWLPSDQRRQGGEDVAPGRRWRWGWLEFPLMDWKGYPGATSRSGEDASG